MLSIRAERLVHLVPAGADEQREPLEHMAAPGSFDWQLSAGSFD